jgi:hypothetical protein
MFHERAAIIEYDGKFPRHMADAIAYWDTFLQFVTNRHPTIRAEFAPSLTPTPSIERKPYDRQESTGKN